MGYNTKFEGEFQVTPYLKEEHLKYLSAFIKTRRMTRDGDKALQLPDPLRSKVGLPIGDEAAYECRRNWFFWTR